LDHASESVDLSRLNSGGALLVDHNTCDQVGVIESARIDGDKKGRAVVRFGKSERAQEIFQDVVDGIRSLVSVGYRINKCVTEKVEQGVETLRAVSWQPMEISIVSIPADTSVGVGRSEDETFVTEIEEMKRSILLDPAPALTAPAGGGAITETRAEGATAERNRAKEIAAMATRLETRVPEIRKIAEQAIESGMTVEAFRARALEMLPEAQPIQKPQLSDVKPKDWARYSISRAAAMMADGKLSGFEKEVSDELALKSGAKAQGVWIPDEAMIQRSHVAGTNTLGGFLVETQNLGSEFIPLLRNRARVLGLGARVLNLSGPVTIPRQAGAGTVNALGETVASTLSAMNFTQLTLTPQAVGAFQQYSKMLLMESNPSIDGLIRDDILQQIALKIDLAALHGGLTASGASVGIAGTTGIKTVALATDGLALGNATAYPAMVSLETLIAGANADVANMAYLMRAGHRGALKTTQRFSSTDTPEQHCQRLRRSGDAADCDQPDDRNSDNDLLRDLLR
jgi:HK97 family phage major capsid protein